MPTNPDNGKNAPGILAQSQISLEKSLQNPNETFQQNEALKTVVNAASGLY